MFTRLKKRERGFTLIEMMVAVVIFVIIIGALFALLSGGQRSWRTQEAYVQVGQEARKAMHKMTRHLRGVDTTDIVVYAANRYQKDIGDLNDDKLNNQIINLNTTNVVANFIESLTFTNNPPDLTISITTSNQTITNVMTETITLRN